ncbi:hypothetical protein G6F65_015359 [Rhizopus arrhizus]|nr:hypothetical protein G6F65_015359 [Rhizopus arrhizus]
MLGQLSLSKPGAFFSVSLSTFSTKHLRSVSSVNAPQGIANSLSPMPSTPPRDRTAYATRPRGTSIMMSLIDPSSSPAELYTSLPSSVSAAMTCGPGPVGLLLGPPTMLV